MNWTDVHVHKSLLSRAYIAFDVARRGTATPQTHTITAPLKALFVRASAVGAGGYGTSPNYSGGGGAFARVKTTTTFGEQFTAQIGDPLHTSPTGDSAGDTTLTRVTGGVLILKAAHAQGVNGGLAAACVGDTTRSGASATGALLGGASAGDDADLYPLGFGGRAGDLFTPPAPGGGGRGNYPLPQNPGIQWALVPGAGLLCIEFFDSDPAAWGYGG